MREIKDKELSDVVSAVDFPAMIEFLAACKSYERTGGDYAEKIGDYEVRMGSPEAQKIRRLIHEELRAYRRSADYQPKQENALSGFGC